MLKNVKPGKLGCFQFRLPVDIPRLDRVAKTQCGVRSMSIGRPVFAETLSIVFSRGQSLPKQVGIVVSDPPKNRGGGRSRSWWRWPEIRCGRSIREFRRNRYRQSRRNARGDLIAGLRTTAADRPPGAVRVSWSCRKPICRSTFHRVLRGTVPPKAGRDCRFRTPEKSLWWAELELVALA